MINNEVYSFKNSSAPKQKPIKKSLETIFSVTSANVDNLFADVDIQYLSPANTLFSSHSWWFNSFFYLIIKYVFNLSPYPGLDTVFDTH